MTRRHFLLIPLLLLAGCASVSHVFDPMTPAELDAEWARCQRGALCRGWVHLIGAESPEIERAANNGKRNCLEHAREAHRILGRGEVYVFCATDRQTMRTEGHAVLLVDGLVIDNGALNGFRVFPERDLDHYERICE